MPTYRKDTDELFFELKDERDLQSYRDRNQAEFLVPLHEYLESLLAAKNLLKRDVIEQSGLSREYAYHIFSGNRKNPSRPKILALAIAMGLDFDEVQYLLRYAGQSPLYPRSPWDSVIISAVRQKLTVPQTNDLLNQLGETLLLD